MFRDAALKNVAILRLIENTLHAKRDHAIGEEFFRDILDEHFSSDEVERQFDTALNWGRYAEIFNYDSATGRLSHSDIADAARRGKRTVMARAAEPVRILGKGPWSLLPCPNVVAADRLLYLRSGPFNFLLRHGAGSDLVRSI